MTLRKAFIAAALAATAAVTATPASAQTRQDEQRWQDAQRRFQQEQSVFDRERTIYENARRRYPGRGGGRYDSSYNDGDYRWRGGERDWDASRYYREDGRYQERVLSSDDQVYRGSDGRYYCRRTDGTTGLIIGAAGGGILGNVIDGGRNRAAGTLIGGALGALLGREIERSNDQYRCR